MNKEIVLETYDVAVIIPAYNCEQYIEACLKSILENFSEDYHVQVIIIDDGSQDNTQNVCRRFSEEAENVFYIFQENKGVSVARNKGVAASNAEYIMFVDSDDSLESGAIELFLNEMDDADFLMAGYVTTDGVKNYMKYSNYAYSGNVDDFANNLERWLFPPYLLSPWSKLFKSNIIKQNNIVFKKGMAYGEDAAFVLDYLNYVQKIKTIASPIYRYRVNNNASLSGVYRDYVFDNDVFVNQMIYDFLKKHQVEDAIEICNRRFVQNFSGAMQKVMLSDMSYREKKETFYRKVEKFSVKEVFMSTVKTGLQERITGMAVVNKLLFPLMRLHELKAYLLQLKKG